MTRTTEMSCKLLPEDLEIEILSRLPVRSLLRFKCVSKSCSETAFLAFGFDPKINDYKLVRINVLVADSGEISSVVQICTLRRPSWRDTELVVPAHISAYRQINTYINGTFNWLAYGSEGNINTILSFHMSDEVFETIKIPDFLLKNHWGQLAMLNGSFAVIHYPKRSGSREPITAKYYEIWATNQSRLEEEAWVRKVAVGPIAGVVETPLAVLGIDVLFLASREGELISCDLRTQEIRKHQIYGVEQWMQVGIYNESLISVE
ncbi:hypothetical protein RHGRI_028443 [Rhododendron griersonianum]|uniref:F-box associated beta-propeller type 3 domain-containing protein n=1 Tax=Rhododendron griersonianum TaxID=479676 RepID=A0AAV6IGK0_9ERIC|nr:hypothetical protein RHGRI_028443 [Rhododendron griersonianum]